MNLEILRSFLFLILHLTLPLTKAQAFNTLCIDDLEDFKTSGWFLNRAFYAENTDALSLILQCDIESANGIFYFTGRSADNAMISDVPADQFQSPTYLYVKYYGYFPSISQDNIYVAPPLDNYDGPIKFLPNTPGVKWGEAVIEIDTSQTAPLEVTALNLGVGEYFLIDKIIVLHEDLGQDFEAIQAKCPPKSTETPAPSIPSSTETEAETTLETGSTESPSAPFECKEPGFFRGGDCTTFHVCLFEKSGLFGNLMFHCPAPQIWCQNSWRCEDLEICPCSFHV